MTTTAQHLAAARKHFAAARTMQRNLRLGRYQGRNSGGDTTFQMRLAAEAARQAGREAEGLLWAEHKDALRLSEARDQDQDRPELRAKMTTYRRRLREMAR